MKYFHCMRKVKDLLFLSDITHCAAILYLPFLLRETPDQFFERPEHNQPRILVTGVDFTRYDMLVDEKCIFHVKVEDIVICRWTDFVYAFTVMIAPHYAFNVAYSKKNRSNNDIISTGAPRNPLFPENTTESSLVNMQNKRHVIILFLKSIKTGQSSENNFNLGFYTFRWWYVVENVSGLALAVN